MPETPPTAKPRLLSVRIASFDDFLVEYTDRLRWGCLALPVPGLEEGIPLRLKVTLPNGQVLYLRGSVGRPQDSRVKAPDANASLVVLQRLDDKQRKQLEECLDLMMAGAATEEPATPSNEAPLSVVLVDDSVSVRIELGEALRARGMQVSVSENGLLGLSAALKERPDVILSDIEMPGMDGWTLLRMARARPVLQETPVVFFTGLSDDVSRLQGYRMGADDYLTKGTPPDEVIARLRAVVLRRQSTQQLNGDSLRGGLEHVSLGSLLSFLENERRSGQLRIERGDGESALVHLRKGRVEAVESVADEASPMERVFALLGWSAGDFQFTPDDAADPSEHALPITQILMEYAKREDEANDGR